MSSSAVIIFASAWLALSIICGMIAEYHDRILAALRHEPLQPDYRAGQPIERNGR